MKIVGRMKIRRELFEIQERIRTIFLSADWAREDSMKKLLSIMLLTGALAFSGCGDNDEFIATGFNGVIPAPTCTDDAYATNANQALTVAAGTGVLANDTPNGATLTFAATSTNGGTIAGNADGSFTYTPALDFFGNDTFTYTLGNSGGVVTCTVTVTVNAVNGFFVDQANGNDGTGSFTNGVPFATVQAALAAAPAGSDIVVRPGSYTGTMTLQNGDRLLGSGSVLAQGVVRPTLSGPVVMADGCTLDYLRIANSPADCVDADGQNGGTVTNCELDTAAGTMQCVSARNIRGNWTISNNVAANATAGGIVVSVLNTDTATVRIEGNECRGNAAGGIDLLTANTAQLDARVAGNTLTNNLLQDFSATAGDSSTFCLDLESNTNDGVYAFAEGITPAVLRIEQLSTLTDVRPGGGGNTGTVSIATGGSVENPTEVADGACGF